MYTVLKSYGIAKVSGSRWQELNLTTSTTEEIFNLYRKVYLKLTAAFLTEPIYVDMEIFRIKYINFQGTLADLFTDNGNESLVTIEQVPNLEVKRAYFSDAYYAGYKVGLTDQSYTASNKQIDLMVEKPNMDLTDVYDHCIFTVNGFFHMSDRDDTNLYVMNGGNTMKRGKENHLGIWSWANVGKLEHVKITDDMLFKQNDESDFSDRVYIKIPGDIQKKTVLLFAGGYFVRPEPGVFYPVGEDTYCFNVGRIPILKRIYESKGNIDYTDLGLDVSTINESMINLEQLFSDGVLRKYLTLPQSFLVLVNAEDVYFEQHPIRTSPMPGMLTSYYEPTFPMFNGVGRSPSYWKMLEKGQWSITVADNFKRNRAFSGANTSTLVNATSHNETIKPLDYSKAYLLEAGIDFELPPLD